MPILIATAILALGGLLVYATLRADSAERQRDSIDGRVAAGEAVAVPGADRRRPVLGGRGTMSLGQLRGQIVVVNIWASWCPPCEDEAPLLQSVHQRLRRANIGTVLGVTNRDDPEQSLAKAREWGITYPSVRDPDSLLARDLGALRVPETFVVDRRGRLVGIFRGEVTAGFLRGALRRAGVPTQVLRSP
ncbi:MAG: TlpA family protein disulfide reductase [Solirubrobacteraceae bacterium]